MVADRLIGGACLQRGVEVGHLEGMVAGLVTDGKEVGARLDQIRDAGVLEAVELILGREFQILFQMVCPEITEMLSRMVFGTRAKSGTEKIPISGT